MTKLTPEERKVRRRVAYLKWREKNPERAVQIRRQANSRWRAAHPALHKERTRVCRIRKYSTDPSYRILRGLRSRQGREINRAGAGKSARTLVLTGCSVAALREYLTSRFVPGMTWDNYGSAWEIDHIKPCAKFDFKDPEQQKACFHWSNLQPLFSLDNRRKGDYYEA